MNRATVTKRAPKPAQLQAERMRRTAASDRAEKAVAALLADLPPDLELAVETLRQVVRISSWRAAELVGSPRALGLLCGAAADVAPAYRTERKFTAAEALFARQAEGEE